MYDEDADTLETEHSPYNPVSKPREIPVHNIGPLFGIIAASTGKRNVPIIKRLLQMAVDKGLVSKQGLKEEFGKETIEKALSPRSGLPSEAVLSKLLLHLSTMPTDTDGQRIPHRHAHPRPKVESSISP